ncbi:hypothetical protein [Corynebacterium caspium]|uniref:hypothetical protein n=1 Tax=Corynebacterium caspium TaxID=234828 RepID=UPI0003600A0A|nr:hypothetical protein [Corynebacterium caspium]WKD59658.1 hypothetical protein CCASP_06375 [Corynebacterium caspium DSM 44850]
MKRIGVILGAAALAGSLTACAGNSANTASNSAVSDTTTTTATSSATTSTTTSTTGSTTATPFEIPGPGPVTDVSADKFLLPDTNIWAVQLPHATCEVGNKDEGQQTMRCAVDFKYAPLETKQTHPNYRGIQNGVQLMANGRGFRPVTLADPAPLKGPELGRGERTTIGDIEIRHEANGQLRVISPQHEFTLTEGNLDSDTWHGRAHYPGDTVDTGASCAAEKDLKKVSGLSIIARADGLDCAEARKIYESYLATGGERDTNETVTKRTIWECHRGPGLADATDGEDTRGVICDASNNQHFLVIPPLKS